MNFNIIITFIILTNKAVKVRSKILVLYLFIQQYSPQLYTNRLYRLRFNDPLTQLIDG